MGSSVTTRRKSWEKSQFWGHTEIQRENNYEYLSLILLEAKFGAPTRISEANFGAKSPDLLIWKYPPPPEYSRNDPKSPISQAILDLIKEKRRLRRLYNNTQDPDMKSTINKLQKEIRTKIIQESTISWEKFVVVFIDATSI